MRISASKRREAVAMYARDLEVECGMDPAEAREVAKVHEECDRMPFVYYRAVGVDRPDDDF